MSRGWTDLLREHGMLPFFDRRRYEWHVFSDEVIAIDLDSWQRSRGIEVFHRRPVLTPAATA